MDVLEHLFAVVPLTTASAPIAALVVLAIIAVVTLLRRRSGRAARIAMPWTVQVAAIAVLVAWIASISLPLELAWRYTLAPAAAALGALLVVLVDRRARAGRASTTALTRRTWRTFVPHRSLIIAGSVAAALVLVTVAAGLASSADAHAVEHGEAAEFRWLQVGGDASGGVFSLVPFFGWWYGVPVVIALAVTLAIVVGALRAIAVAPFRDAAVAAETAERTVRAHGIVLVTTFAMLVLLGGVLQFIGFAGASGLFVPADDGTEYSWTSGFAGIAVPSIIVGWLLQVAALTGLLGIVAGFWPRRGMRASANSATR